MTRTPTAATVPAGRSQVPLPPVRRPVPVPARGAPTRSAARRTPQPPQAPEPGQRALSGRCHTVTAPTAGAVRVPHSTPAPHGVRPADHPLEAAARSRQHPPRRRRSPQPGPVPSPAPTPAAPPRRMGQRLHPAERSGPTLTTQTTPASSRKEQTPPKGQRKPMEPRRLKRARRPKKPKAPPPAPKPPPKPEIPTKQLDTRSYRPTLSTPRRSRRAASNPVDSTPVVDNSATHRRPGQPRRPSHRGETTTPNSPGPVCAPITAPTSLTCSSLSPVTRSRSRWARASERSAAARWWTAIST